VTHSRAPVPLVAALAALLALASAAGPARAGARMYLGYGPITAVAPTATDDPSDTVGVGIYVDLDTVTARLKAVEFYVAFQCSVDVACKPYRSLDVVNFEPNRDLMDTPQALLCDEICACNACEAFSHWFVPIRTDRVSTMPRRARVGTLHVRSTRATRKVGLEIPIARLWVFSIVPGSRRAIDLADGSGGASFGGVSPAGATRWGILKRLYR
jgi:hypothetical protein